VQWKKIFLSIRDSFSLLQAFGFELLDTSSKWRILLNTYLWWRILALRLSARQAVSLCFYLETVDFFSTPKCKWDDCSLWDFFLSRGLNLTFPLFTALTFSQAWSIHTILYRYRLTGLSNKILFSFRQLLYCARLEAGKFHTPDFLREWINLVTSDFFSFRHNGRLASTRSFQLYAPTRSFQTTSTFRFRAGKSIQLKLGNSRRLTRDDSGVQVLTTFTLNVRKPQNIKGRKMKQKSLSM